MVARNVRTPGIAVVGGAGPARIASRPLLSGLLCMAVCLGCGRTPEQRAVAAVERLGGKVKFDGRDTTGAVVEVDLSRTPVTDADLELLHPLQQLQTLNLSGTAVSDRGLAALRNCRNLRKLNLNLTKISDAGPANLIDLPELAELYLIETKLTDACLADLARLSHLKRLVLLRTALGAAAVQELRRQLPNTTVQIEPGPRPVP